MTLEGALEIHNDVLNKINSATKVSEIPTVGKGDYEKRIKVFFKDNVLSSDSLKELVDAIADEKDEADVQLALMNVCKSLNLGDEANTALFEEVNEQLSTDPVLAYLSEEIKARNAKIEELIGKNYEDIRVFNVPTHEGEFEGKRFYNCYINKVDNLALEVLVGESSVGSYPDETIEIAETAEAGNTEGGQEMDLSSYSQTNNSNEGMDLSSYSAAPANEETTPVAEENTDLSSFGTVETPTEEEKEPETTVEDTVETTISTNNTTATEVVNSEGSKSLLEIQGMINELIKNDNIKEAEFQRAKAEYMEYKKEFKTKLQELNAQIAAMISDTDKSLGN